MKTAGRLCHVDDTDTIENAARHWSSLAAFAWASAQASGPGAVVMHKADLAESEPAMHWFAASDVPAGDDFRSLMLQYDATRQVVLIVVDEAGDQAIVLEAGDDRQTPPQCT